MVSSSWARTLHMVSRMKVTVGILAAGLFLGCGVGVDDVEGQLAAYGQVHFVQPLSDSGQTVTGNRVGEVHSFTDQMQSTVQSKNAQASGDTVNSPVDPIPAFDPRLPLHSDTGPFPIR